MLVVRVLVMNSLESEFDIELDEPAITDQDVPNTSFIDKIVNLLK